MFDDANANVKIVFKTEKKMVEHAWVVDFGENNNGLDDKLKYRHIISFLKQKIQNNNNNLFSDFYF